MSGYRVCGILGALFVGMVLAFIQLRQIYQKKKMYFVIRDLIAAGSQPENNLKTLAQKNAADVSEYMVCAGM
jgi:hypothetical protein